MQLYNTLTRDLEDVKPIDGKQVRIYSCGPTVYDYAHIGNWYSFLRWDLLNRTLLSSGLQTKWVMNITDVGHLVSDEDHGDDKLQLGAAREGKTAWDIAKFYADDFKQRLIDLNFSTIDELPYATEHIQQQIELIKTLEGRGLTYQIDDGVYYDTSQIADYGKLARLDVDSLQEGARVKANSQKRNPADFALWKSSPQGSKRDMEWDSPWGKGFPGWHVECSAMSQEYLGDHFDIHTGGIDHIPVHHTNEIAQSEGANQVPLAEIWVHSNFIQVDGKKMSKSASNFYTLQDVEDRGYSLAEFRLATLASHYSTEANFSWDLLHEARERMTRLWSISAQRFQPHPDAQRLDANYLTQAYDAVLSSLQANLNSPQALSQLDAIYDHIETITAGVHPDDIKELQNFIDRIDGLLGLDIGSLADITDQQKRSLAERSAARQAKDWEASDKLRVQLEAQGITIRDGKHGQVWSRKLGS